MKSEVDLRAFARLIYLEGRDYSCPPCGRRISVQDVPRHIGELLPEPDNCGFCGRGLTPKAIEREELYARTLTHSTLQEHRVRDDVGNSFQDYSMVQRG